MVLQLKLSLQKIRRSGTPARDSISMLQGRLVAYLAYSKVSSTPHCLAAMLVIVALQVQQLAAWKVTAGVQVAVQVWVQVWVQVQVQVRVQVQYKEQYST